MTNSMITSFDLERLLGATNYYKLHNDLKNKDFQENTRRIHRHFYYANIGILLGLFFAIPSSFYERWIFGGLFCQFYSFLGFFSGMSNINLLVAIAMERYYSAKREHSPFRWINLIIVCWLVGLFWSVLPLLGFGRYSIEQHRTSCSLKIFDHSPNHYLYILGLIFVGYLLPVLVAIVFHVLTWNLENRKIGKIIPSEISLNIASRQIFLVALAAWSCYLIESLIMLYDNRESTLSLWVSYLSPLTSKFGVAVIPWFYPKFI